MQTIKQVRITTRGKMINLPKDFWDGFVIIQAIEIPQIKLKRMDNKKEE